MKYLFDSDILINSNRYVPRKRFGSFWDKIEEYIESDEIGILKIVRNEIEKGTDDLYNWLSRFPATKFINEKAEEEVLLIVKDIVNKYPDLVNPLNTGDQADPYLVAYAKVRNLSVITYESPRSPKKIPEICKTMGVNCMNLEEFLEKENLSF